MENTINPNLCHSILLPWLLPLPLVVMMSLNHLFLTHFRSPDFLVKGMPSLATPPAPLHSSTPSSTVQGSVSSAADSQGGANIRKRRRLAANPGGLHWNSAGKLTVQDFSVQSVGVKPRIRPTQVWQHPNILFTLSGDSCL